jgi:hypothetical protein
MHQNLVKFYQNEVKKAKAEKDVAKAVKNLRPLVKRLEKDDNAFKAERNAIETTLSDLLANANQGFDDLVNEGRSKLNNRDNPKTLKETTTKLAKEIKACRDLLPESKEQCEAMHLLSEHIKAWGKLLPALEQARPIAEKYGIYKKAVAEAKAKQLAEAPQQQPQAEPQGGQKGEGQQQQTPSPPKPLPPLKLPKGVEEVSSYDLQKAKQDLREGIDAATCSKMDEDFQSVEVEEANKLGHELDGLPPAQPCNPSGGNFVATSADEASNSDSGGGGGNFFSNIWNSLFGSSALHSTSPAILTCVLLGLPLWSFDA